MARYMREQIKNSNEFANDTKYIDKARNFLTYIKFALPNLSILKVIFLY